MATAIAEKKKSGKAARLPIAVTPSELERIDERAQYLGINRSGFIRFVIQSYFRDLESSAK